MIRSCRGSAVWISLALSSGCAAPEAPSAAVERPAAVEADLPDDESAAPTLPPIPPDQLPPLTGIPPDPATEQFSRGSVHIRIGEVVEPREGDPYTPRTPLLQIHLEEYFRRAGYRVVEGPSGADHRLEGEFHAGFSDLLTFMGRIIAMNYDGRVSLKIRDAAGNLIDEMDVTGRVEDVTLSSKFGEGGEEWREERHAVTDLERKVAKLVWERLFYGLSVFTDGEIPGLIDSLAIPAPPDRAVDATEVVRKLAARRLAAVPYLIEALSDERPVVAAAEYPGLTELNHNRLRVYHLADRALEEIFQKVSRMNLDTPRRHRFVIIRGWEGEWKRFCPSYRHSRPGSRSEESADPPPAAGAVAGPSTSRD